MTKFLEEKAKAEFEATYKVMSDDQVRDILCFDEEDDRPEAKDLTLLQSCDILGVPTAAKLADVKTLADVMLRIEFARSYLHRDAEEFFCKLKKRRKLGKEDEYLFFDSEEAFNDGVLDPCGFEQADWKGAYGVCYFAV